MSIEISTQEKEVQIRERTSKIVISCPPERPISVSISRQIVNGAKPLSPTAFKGFKPQIELSQAKLDSAGNFEWRDHQGRKRIFDSQDLKFLISAFCDKVSK